MRSNSTLKLSFQATSQFANTCFAVASVSELLFVTYPAIGLSSLKQLNEAQTSCSRTTKCLYYIILSTKHKAHDTLRFRCGTISANDTSVFRVEAVVAEPAVVSTASDGLLVAAALNVVHENWCINILLSKIRISGKVERSSVIQHHADDIRLSDAPVIVTYRPPYSRFIDKETHLYSTLV